MSQYSHALSLSSVCTHLEQNKHLAIPQGKKSNSKRQMLVTQILLKILWREGKMYITDNKTKFKIYYCYLFFPQTFLQVLEASSIIFLPPLHPV